MTAPRKRNQHYVPQFMLRNWSPDRRSVGAFVLATKHRIERAGIAGQCARAYFYGHTPEMEDAFAESEGHVSNLLRSSTPAHLETLDKAGPYMTRAISDVDVLRTHPLYRLREYVYYQCHRTAAAAADAEHLGDIAAKNLLAMHPVFRARFPAPADMDKFRVVPTEGISHILYNAGAFHFVMLDLAVKFLIAKPGAPAFIISDDPVVLQNQYTERLPPSLLGHGALGMAARGLQIFMPMSPSVTIAIYDPEVYEYGSPHTIVANVGTRDVRGLNALQAANARDCIYFDPRTEPALDRLRDEWLDRPDARPCVIDRPVRAQADGTVTQTTLHLPRQRRSRTHLSCVRVTDRTTQTFRINIAGERSVPIRSPQLYEDAEDFRRYMDWTVKQAILERGLAVHPHWKSWLESVENPARQP